jgi:hypothetical protein
MDLILAMKTMLYGVQYAFDMEFGTTLDPAMISTGIQQSWFKSFYLIRCEIKTFNRAKRTKMKN